MGVGFVVNTNLPVNTPRSWRGVVYLAVRKWSGQNASVISSSDVPFPHCETQEFE